ncbi:hypothetical protein PSN_1431 [Pseudomonas sp. NGC7]|jgi:hypothetical protein
MPDEKAAIIAAMEESLILSIARQMPWKSVVVLNDTFHGLGAALSAVL